MTLLPTMHPTLSVFESWPSETVFEECTESYQPFIVSAVASSKLECEKLLSRLSECQEPIDLSCAEFDEEFNGNPIYREKVDVVLANFMEHFMAADKGESHWLEELTMQLYLSQCSIFSDSGKVELPGFEDAVTRPPLLAATNQELTSVCLWVNILKASSTMHYDGYHNLLTVYKGSKEVLLISPSNSVHLAPLLACKESPNHSSLTTDAVVSLIGSTITRDYYPVILNEGDCLFIPEGWWHAVVSKPCTVAVSHMFSSSIQRLLARAPHMNSYLMRSAAHDLVHLQVQAADPAYFPAIELPLKRMRLYIDARNKDSFYCQNLTTEGFEAFMDSLHASIGKDSSDSAGGGSPVDSSSKGGYDRNAECCKLTRCDIEFQLSFWLPYSRTHPDKWTDIFLSLTPQAMHLLVSYWDTLTMDYVRSNEGTSFELDQYYQDIFEPCGERTTAVRRHMIEQNDKWTEREFARTVDTLLLGK